MAKAIWLDDAKDDVRAILEYMDAENPAAAAKYVAGIADACGTLADFPHSGRRYNPEFRRLVFRNHSIFYRVAEEADEVRIAAVIDGRRDIAALIGEED